MKKWFVLFLWLGSLVGCGSRDGGLGLIPAGDRIQAPEIQADFLNLPVPAPSPQAPPQGGKKKNKVPPLPAPTLRLADLRGKVVVLDFWATWCGPCRMELPGLVKLRAGYRSRGLEVVGLSVEINDNQPRENFKKFLAGYNIDYPVGLASLETLQNYGVNPIPATFFIDKKGRVALSFVGARPEEQFTAAVEKLLAE